MELNLVYDTLALLAAIPTGLLVGYFLLPRLMRRWPEVIILNSARIVFLLAAATSIPYSFVQGAISVSLAPAGAESVSLERRLVLSAAWIVFVTAMAAALRVWIRRHPPKTY